MNTSPKADWEEIRIRVPRELLERIDQEASVHDMTRNQAFIAGVTSWLGEWSSWHAFMRRAMS